MDDYELSNDDYELSNDESLASLSSVVDTPTTIDTRTRVLGVADSVRSSRPIACALKTDEASVTSE